MKKKKWVCWSFLSTDYKAMEEYLENMARKGWMLEKVGRGMARFNKIQPQELTFYVDVFKDEGPLVPENTSDSREYRSLCEDSGWQFITSQDYLQFFYAQEEKNPTPIQTDGEMELRLVRNSLLKQEFLGIALLMFIIRESIYRLLFNPYYYFLSIPSMVGGLGILLFVLHILGMAVYFLIWMIQSKKRLHRGLGMEVPSLKTARRRALLFSGARYLALPMLLFSLIEDKTILSDEVVVIFIVIAIAIGIGSLFRYFIKKKGKRKDDGLYYFILGMVLWIVFLPVVVRALFGFIDHEPSYYDDEVAIPEGYPIVTMNELSGNEQGEVTWWEFHPRSSPIIPMSYVLKGDLSGRYLDVNYYRSIHPSIGRMIFQGKVKELQKFLNYFDHSTIRDEDLRGRWGVEDLILSQNRDTLIIRKGPSVLYLSGSALDFESQELIQGIMEYLDSQQ